MRSTLARPLAILAALVLVVAACSDDDTDDATEPLDQTTTSTTSDPDDDPEVGGITEATDDRSSWTPEQARAVRLDDDTTIPLIDPTLADDRVIDDLWLWDWWPVRDRDGEVADFDGWQVAIALSAPSDVLPGKRHDIATHRYLITDDGGVTWQDGGDLFADSEPLGSRQWAGSAMYDDATGELFAFYTAAGEAGEEIDVSPADETTVTSGPDAGETTTTTADDAQGAAQDDGPDAGETTTTTGADETEGDETATSTPALSPSGGELAEGISYEQRMAVASATIEVTDDGISFTDWSEHTIILEGDDELYASTAGTTGGAGSIDAFRDPWFYRDPATDAEYLLFTATLVDDESECDADGVVGIAELASEDLTDWELLPPLFDADCVNKELERPFIVNQGDAYYLMFTTHSHTFAPEFTDAPEGLYGFVADDLFGDYEPLNEGGLVLGNPADDPYQAYSWMALPDGQVLSFFQYFGLEAGQGLDYIGSQSPELQIESFGGTFAPTIVIELDGATTSILDELGPGQMVVDAAS
ncbi:MAG TPA: glycoside hydrolase family 68 protein [Acidimicrobiales bacterium]|nr:glycoside hydrolase family 68 protein [Acidimicrobiales bacterium]